MAELEFTPLNVPPVQTQTATDQVFDAMYSAVISLRLPPGTKVSEAEVAKQLDVSRQPVRDAFFRLSKLGFLSIRPQRATLITKISERAVLEAVFTRTALEVECIRLAAARRTQADLDRLTSSLVAQDRALAASDPSEFHALDEAFHRMLCEIAGHPHVWELIREQKAHMDRVRFLTLSEPRRRTVHQEHHAIVAAIAAQDTAQAEALLRGHLGDLGNALTRIRADHAAYFEGDPA